MPVNGAAENVLGTVGTICWTVQVIPQIWKSWREKSTEGLSLWLMFLWGVAAAFLAVYNVSQNLNIPLIVQPHLFGLLSLTSWAQCLFYDKGRSARFAKLSLICALIVFAGFETGMIYAIRPARRKGNDGPATFFGTAVSVVLSVGLLPQYFEIYRNGEVKGISLLFMTIDLLGGVFSMLSLVFKPKFDILAGVAYTLVVVLDGIVIILALVLNPLAERRRRSAAATVEEEAPEVGEAQRTSPSLHALGGAEEEATANYNRSAPSSTDVHESQIPQ